MNSIQLQTSSKRLRGTSPLPATHGAPPTVADPRLREPRLCERAAEDQAVEGGQGCEALGALCHVAAQDDGDIAR